MIQDFLYKRTHINTTESVAFSIFWNTCIAESKDWKLKNLKFYKL